MTKSEQNFIAQKIRTEYEEKPIKSDVETLRELDAKVKRPANIFSYTFGGISALVLGAGMSLAMQIIGAGIAWSMPVGIAVGIVGIAMAALTYPIYNRILASRKAKYADEILALSDKIIGK